jgi:hypothetical protein
VYRWLLVPSPHRGIVSWIIVAFALASCGHRGPVPAPPPETPQLWYWHHSLLNSSAGLQASVARIDQAYADGYTGIAFWDIGFMYLNSPAWPSGAAAYLRQAMTYAQSKGMKVLALAAPYGYSNDVLNTNPNWAEAQRAIGSRFDVDASGRGLRFVNSSPGVANGGFESGQADWIAKNWYGMRDQGVDIDPLTSHTGLLSGVVRNAPRNGRFHQALTLTPWRQYHVRLWARTQDYHGPVPALEVLDTGNSDEVRLYKYLNISATQDWTRFDATFNSQESSGVSLYFGIWGTSAGTIWFDDVSIEETALVYLVRRSGTPLKIYDPATRAIFHEGVDVDPIHDPNLTADPHDDYHNPPVVTLPPATTMKPGQIVAIDYYAVQPVYGHQLGLCLTEPDVQAWALENSRAIAAAVPPHAGFFLSYDEMRQMNSCALCRSRHMTAGELLALHVGNTINLYGSLRPEADIYVWSDMFDPYANAHNHYFLVEGDLAGSWKGLPPGVIVMNWNLEHLRDSLDWFSGGNRKQPVPHRQIIAGYYDSHDGAAAAAAELRQARGIPGIDGLMYTTWIQDDSQMKTFAEAAKRLWTEYRSSVTR